MSSYIIVESNVLDVEKLKQYGQLAAPTVAKYGGEFVVKGKAISMHGDNQYTNRAVIKFTDKATAEAWYASDAYQALVELRNQAMHSQFHLVESM